MSQKNEILKALQKGRHITPLDALAEWGCMRLGGRCHELRKAGHNISTDIVKSSNGKRYASYWLAQ